MGFIDGIMAGLGHAFDPNVLSFIALGAVFGLIIGAIPGLSGHFAMALVLTFLYAMDPQPGLAFLLAAHATVAQGGGLTAILFSTPGTGQNAATLLDGPKMRDKGQAGRAVGAAMTACFLGATFGAIVLALLIPVLREVVLYFGTSEIFMLAVLGLVFVVVLGRRDLMRSLVAALLGLFLSLVGTDNATNKDRFTAGSEIFADGLALVPVVLGLFAMAEMIALSQRGGVLNPETQNGRSRQAQIFQGVRDAFVHWWLIIRCSSIGTAMGIVPGLGSAAASFVAYGHARQTSKTPELFETGTIEGVIAPEAANDAVEGGALASTVAFGIPGSSSMAILLSGLLILGIEPGPRMLNDGVDILFLMVFTIVIANLIGTVFGMALANPLTRLSTLPAYFMVPGITAIIIAGAYAYGSSIGDVWIVVIFGLVGYLCSILRYSRAALLIGFVLGGPIEYNLHLSLQLKGAGFVFEPLSFAIAAIALALLIHSCWGIWKDTRSAGPSPSGKLPAEKQQDPVKAARLLKGELVFLSAIVCVIGAALYETIFHADWNKAVPNVVLYPLACILVLQLSRVVGLLQRLKAFLSQPPTAPLTKTNAFLSVVVGVCLLPPAVHIFGHLPTIFCFVLMVVWIGRSSIPVATVSAILITGGVYALFEIGFDLALYDGLVLRYFQGYRDFAGALMSLAAGMG